MALCRFKKNKRWIIKALNRRTRRTVAWVVGRCDIATFLRLYDKVKHLTGCTFYTATGAPFAAVLPKGRHRISKTHTTRIGQDNMMCQRISGHIKLLNNPVVWMLQVDGIVVDIRQAPLELQELAFEQSYIPFIPSRQQ